MDRKKTRIGTIMLMLGVAISGNAQSGVTYNHDSSKKNQITVMEIGSGSLSPELYYQLLHSSYKKSAASKNKLGFVPRQESELTIKWNMPKPSTLP